MIFLGGLPRSGSTLLANIINQNPEFHATETSGLIDIVYPIKNGWNDVANHKTLDSSISRMRLISVLEAVMDYYHSENTGKMIVDKNRGWLGAIEMLDALYGEELKIIVTVRDIVDVLASIEMRFRDTNKWSITQQEKESPLEMVTIEKRLAFWLRNEQLLGSAYNVLRDILIKGYRDRIHLIEYKDLTHYPEETLEIMYEYLGFDKFKHDFDNVEQVTQEDDRVHGFADLHTIRKKVAPNKTKWQSILGEAGNPYLNQEFWRLA